MKNENNKQEKTKKPMLTIRNLKEYLISNGIRLSYDIHKKNAKVEYSISPKYQEDTMFSNLYSDLRNISVGVSRDVLNMFLDAIALEESRNHILELIETTVWDGKDRLTEIYRHLGIMNDELSKILPQQSTYYLFIIVLLGLYF